MLKHVSEFAQEFNNWVAFAWTPSTYSKGVPATAYHSTITLGTIRECSEPTALSHSGALFPP